MAAFQLGCFRIHSFGEKTFQFWPKLAIVFGYYVPTWLGFPGRYSALVSEYGLRGWNLCSVYHLLLFCGKVLRKGFLDAGFRQINITVLGFEISRDISGREFP